MSLSMPAELLVKFAIGFCGAAFTMYSNIGGDLPLMGKSIEIKNLTADISDLQEKVRKNEDELKTEKDKLSRKEISVAHFTVIERSMNNQRDDWNEEIKALRKDKAELRRSTYFQGAVIFLILGGFFATFLTGGALLEGDKLNVQTILSAVAIGAGWTGIISQYLQTGAIKEEKIDVNNKLVDIKDEYDHLKDKVIEYSEKLDVAKKETVAVASEYDSIVDMLKARVEDGREIVEKFNTLKEAIKDTPIMEELTKLGVEL
jgi:hypothetical protein